MRQFRITTNESNRDHAKGLIQSAIESEIQRFRRSLVKTNNLLEKFEQKYKTSSEYFFVNRTAQDLEGQDDEYISWKGEFLIKQALTKSLQELESIE